MMNHQRIRRQALQLLDLASADVLLTACVAPTIRRPATPAPASQSTPMPPLPLSNWRRPAPPPLPITPRRCASLPLPAVIKPMAPLW
jgi:hypothetical protein